LKLDLEDFTAWGRARRCWRTSSQRRHEIRSRRHRRTAPLMKMQIKEGQMDGDLLTVTGQTPS
jgi:hypothetical protein